MHSATIAIEGCRIAERMSIIVGQCMEGDMIQQPADQGPRKKTKEELVAMLAYGGLPRSATYDPEWMLANAMGPNPVWLAEAASQVMSFSPGMRVLDMGCGRAISSIFLAREFQVEVWATDLWIDASENWQRICKVGLQDQVFPMQAEAHKLPFARDFFDALVSFDAYHYFGTDDLYLDYYTQFVRPGGQIAIVVPGLLGEFNTDLPAHLALHWQREFWSFHSPTWWRVHWQKTGLVDVEGADSIPDGWQLWLRWLEVSAEQGLRADPHEIEMLRLDAGRHLGFTRMVARRR